MTDEAHKKGTERTRRNFLTATTALAGAALVGFLARRRRGATSATRNAAARFSFGTRDDSVGLDTHRNFIYFVSHPLAGMTGGLLDFDDEMDWPPASPSEWDVSKDLKTWTFKLRSGAEFHNGETIDANSVKWNLERIKDPKIGHSFTRAALADLERVTVDDKYTVHCHLKEPNAALRLRPGLLPGQPDGPRRGRQGRHASGRLRPVQVQVLARHDICELVRFENFWETDSEGNTLPYLDGMIGKPKKEDRVRLTALRTHEVDLIDNVAYADAPGFIKDYGKDVRHLGGAAGRHRLHLLQSQERAFSSERNNPDAHMLRRRPPTPSTTKASTRRCSTTRARSPRASTASRAPGTRKDIEPWPKFDPDKAKALRKKAKDGDDKFLLIANDTYPYMHQSGELVHAMLKDAGFNVSSRSCPTPVIQDKHNKGEFDIDSSANSYRIDPDGWFSRTILSTAPETRRRARLREREGRPVHPGRRASRARQGQAASRCMPTSNPWSTATCR